MTLEEEVLARGDNAVFLVAVSSVGLVYGPGLSTNPPSLIIGALHSSKYKLILFITKIINA